MIPKITEGNSHTDSRGTVFFNNNFDASAIKKIYVIENRSADFMRCWQGHKVEQRWFSVIKGVFRIQLIAIDNWENPSRNLEKITFIINSNQLDILHIPQGYVSSIQSVESDSKLLVMADYRFNEINDDYKFSPDYFENE
jgi:dTDP-4-dehydrorhamnose 3,5-epimerase-like enzyme